MATTSERRKIIKANKYMKSEAQMKAETQAYIKKQAEEQKKAKSDAGFVERYAETAWDIEGKLLSGVGKGVEGIVDLLIGGVGLVGGIFSEDFKEGAKRAVEYDVVGNLYGNAIEERTADSWLNDNKVGEVVEQVAEGVGEMLPTVLVAIATGGTSAAASGASAASSAGAAASAASKAAKVSRIASTATMAASAAGRGAEEALNDGAELEGAMAYGALSGATEAVTENLVGGVFGKSLNVGKGAAKTGAKRVIQSMAEEAGEEVLAEAVSPLLKTTYKGTDALSEYTDPEYYKGVLQAGLVGGLTSAAYGGTVGHAIHSVRGTNADVDAVIDSMSDINKEKDKLFAKGKMSAAKYADLQSNIKANMQSVETVLKKASPEQRQKLIEKYKLEGLFDGDGNLDAEYVARLDKRIEAGRTGEFSPYVSPDLAADRERLASDLDALNADPQNFENVSDDVTGNEFGVDNAVQLQYNKKGMPYDSFSTEAMKWAFSTKTKPGDVKLFYNSKDNTWNKLVADDTEDRYATVLSIQDTPENEGKIKKLYKEVDSNGNHGEQQRISEGVHKDYDRYWSFSTGDRNDNRGVEEQGANGRSREVHGSESDGDGDGNSRQSDRNKRGENLKYSRYKGQSYDSFSTEAMKWARATVRQKGDRRALYNAKNNTWNLIEAVDSDDMFVVVKSVKDTSKNLSAIENLMKEVRNDSNRAQSRSNKMFYENIDVYWAVRRNDKLHSSDVRERGADGRNGGVYQGKSEHDGEGASRQGDSNKRGETLKYSRYKEQSDGDYVYTENQYNHFGWAREVGAISKNELDDLYSKIQQSKSLSSFKKSENGEYIVEVNDAPNTMLGVNNVFVFVKGAKANFIITRTIRFDAQTEIEMEIYKEVLYEGRTCRDTYLSLYQAQGLTREYRRKDTSTFVEYAKRRVDGEASRRAYRDNRRSDEYRNGYTFASGEVRKNEIASDGDEIRYSREGNGEKRNRVRIFDGEFDNKGKEYYSDVKRAANNLNAISGRQFNIALVNGNVNFKGVIVNGDNIYINADRVQSGNAIGDLIHELTHFTEGSREYNALMKLLVSDTDSLRRKIVELTREGNAYGFTPETVENLSRMVSKSGTDENADSEDANKEPQAQYSKNDNFKSEIDEWSRDGKPDGEYFILGTTGDVLQGLGAIESDIYMRSEKINTILKEHPEMTLDEIKKIPEILEDPVLILKSRNVGRENKSNTRLVIFGSIKAKNGQPVLSVLDLRPNEKNLVIDDMQKLTSAYTKTQNATEFVRNSDVVYADKKRTTPLLRAIGFQMPIALQQSGYIGSISYFKLSVKILGKNFSDVVKEKNEQKSANLSSKKVTAPSLTSIGFQMPTELRQNDYTNSIHQSKAFVNTNSEKKAKYSKEIVNKKDEAPTNNGVSRPVGNAIPNASSEDIIHQNSENVNTNSENISDKEPQVHYSRKSFSEQIDDVLNGKDTSNTHLRIMNTPNILKKAGLPDLPILMTAKHLKTITAHSGNGNANYHGLDVDIVKKLPQYLLSPVMIADSLTRDDSVVIVTEAVDAENRPVIAAIMLNGVGRLDGKYIDANIMTSAYGKDNFQSFINRIAESNSVIYWDEKKSQNMSVNLGIQFPNVITSLDSNTIIHQSKAFVNTNSENISEANVSDGETATGLEGELLSEIVAGLAEDSIGMDGAFIDKLVRGNDTLAAKLLNKIESMTAYLASRKTPEAREQYKRLKQAEKLFTDALAATGKTYRRGNVVGAVEEEEDEASRAQYSFINSVNGMANDNLLPYDEELKTIIEQRGDYIVDSYEKLKNVVDLSFADTSHKATAYFGMIDSKILEKIENSIQNIPQELKGNLFKKGREYSVSATFDSIRHIVDDKKLSKENVIEYLDRLADTVVDFDSVTFDYYQQGQNKLNGLLFKKKFNDGTFISFSLVSHKKRNIALQSLYLNSVDYQKKKVAETLPMQNAPAHTPEARVSQPSNDIIHQNSDDVKSKLQYSRKSVGQKAQERANKSKEKVYTLYHAKGYAEIINNMCIVRYNGLFDYEGEELKKLVDMLRHGLNTYQEGRAKSEFAKITGRVVAIQVRNALGTDVITDSEFSDFSDAIRKMMLEEHPLLDGRKSDFAKYVEKHYFKEEKARKENIALKERIKLTDKLMHQISRLKEQKNGAFLSASDYKDDVFKSSIDKLININFRGAINVSGTRKIISGLSQWYSKENPMLGERYHDEGIADILNAVANGEGGISNAELEDLNTVLKHFVHMSKTWNKVYEGGKWQDAKVKSQEKQTKMREAKRTQTGLSVRIFSGKYFRAFADPASVFRAADGYDENGFFTTSFESLRNNLLKMTFENQEMYEKHDAFLKDKSNKGYIKRLTEEKLQYRGNVLTVGKFISLYMTSKRKQSWAAFVRSGFVMLDEKGNRIDFAPLAEDLDGIETQDDMKKYVDDMRKDMEGMLTEKDKQYIKIVEEIYKKCSVMKKKTDMLRLGISNAIDDYYYPIKRYDVAKKVDDMFAEVRKTSNMSFNRDTVNSSNKLLIESVETVLKRHTEGVLLYSNFSIWEDNINRVLNVDTGNEKWTHETLRGEIEKNASYKRCFDYLMKLKNDIVSQKSVDDPDYKKFMAKLRGAYAEFQLGFNLKTILTQPSALLASGSILDYSSIVRGMSVKGTYKDVDKYCLLAKFRKSDNTVVKAQTVTDKVGKIGDVGMLSMALMDSRVIATLFGACQIQVQKDMGLRLGTHENKVEAGKLLEKVILETQQNSLLTERTATMRSDDEFKKSFTMFKSDVTKTTGRVYDGFGEFSVIKRKLKLFDPNKNAAEIARLENERAEISAELQSENKIAEEKRRTANQSSTGLSRPVGYAMKNSSSTNSISENSQNVNSISENNVNSQKSNNSFWNDVRYTDAESKSIKRDIRNKIAMTENDVLDFVSSVYDVPENSRMFVGKLPAKLADEVENKTGISVKGKSLVLTRDEIRHIFKHHGDIQQEAKRGQEAITPENFGEVISTIFSPDNILSSANDKSGITSIVFEKNVHGKVVAVTVVSEKKQAITLKSAWKIKKEQHISPLSDVQAPNQTPDSELSMNVAPIDSIPENSQNVNSISENNRSEIEERLAAIDERLEYLRNEKKHLEQDLKRAEKKLYRSVSALVSSSIYMALLSLAFKLLYGKYKDKELEEITADTVFDFFGNMLGGLPIYSDIYSFITDGYEVDIFALDMFNQLLYACTSSITLAKDALSGKDVTRQDVAATVKKVVVSTGMLFGIPVRNAYNLTSGLLNTFLPQTGYALNDFFGETSRSADLKRAIENEDEKMIGVITSLMIGEGDTEYTATTEKALNGLLAEGYSVLPRSVGDTVTYNGVAVELDRTQKKKIKSIYSEADKAVNSLTSLSEFQKAPSDVRAKAIRFINNLYYRMALDEVLGDGEKSKYELFAVGIDVYRLAIIIALAQSIEADKDANGNAISGSKKKKVMDFIEAQRLTAAQKHMLAGALGYTNTKGEQKVTSYISTLPLTQQEKSRLLEYSGYKVA